MRKLALLILLIFALHMAAARAYAEPAYVLKTVDRSYVYSSDGKLLESKIYVTLKVRGLGTYTLHDKTYLVKPGSAEFYGDKPTSIDYRNGFVSVEWSGLRVDGEKIITYTAEPLTEIVNVKTSLKVNGKKAHKTCSGGFCTVNGTLGDSFEYTINLSNVFQLDGRRIPITVVVTLLVDPDKVRIKSTTPIPDSATTMGSMLLLTWGVYLENNASITVRGTIVSLDSWNECPLPLLKISTSLDPSKTLEQAQKLAEQLRDTLKAVSAVEELGNASSDALKTVLDTLENIDENMASFEENLTQVINASKSAYEKLMNASKYAKMAASSVEELAELIPSIEKLNETLAGALKDAKELERLIKNMKGNLSSNGYASIYSSELLETLQQIDSKLELNSQTISKIYGYLTLMEKTKKAAGESKEALEELSGWLEIGGEAMLQLSVALEKAKEQLEKTRSEASVYRSLLEARTGKVEEGLNNIIKVRKELEKKLTDLNNTKILLEELKSIYASETPRLDAGERSMSGILICDEVSFSVPNIRIRSQVNKAAIQYQEPKTISKDSSFAVLLAALPITSLLAYSLKFDAVSANVDELEKRVIKANRRLNELLQQKT